MNTTKAISPMNIDQDEKLEAARYDSIVERGIGGHVKARDFKLIFQEIDAKTFAQIMYATDRMSFEPDHIDDEDPAHIPLIIAKYDFENSRHFGQVMDIFRRHFKTHVVKY